MDCMHNVSLSVPFKARAMKISELTPRSFVEITGIGLPVLANYVISIYFLWLCGFCYNESHSTAVYMFCKYSLLRANVDELELESRGPSALSIFWILYCHTVLRNVVLVQCGTERATGLQY